jgi:hypothetical protein
VSPQKPRPAKPQKATIPVSAKQELASKVEEAPAVAAVQEAPRRIPKDKPSVPLKAEKPKEVPAVEVKPVKKATPIAAVQEAPSKPKVIILSFRFLETLLFRLFDEEL